MSEKIWYLLMGALAAALFIFIVKLIIHKKQLYKKWRKVKKADRYLIFLYSFLVLFIAAMIKVYLITGSEMVVLIGAVFTATVGEQTALAQIKRDNIKNERKNEVKVQDELEESR